MKPIRTKLADLVKSNTVSFLCGSKVWISRDACVGGGGTTKKCIMFVCEYFNRLTDAAVILHYKSHATDTDM